MLRKEIPHSKAEPKSIYDFQFDSTIVFFFQPDDNSDNIEIYNCTVNRRSIEPNCAMVALMGENINVNEVNTRMNHPWER